MENNNLFQIAQQSFRITVGAATSLVETVQNPQKRAEALSQIQTDLSQKTQEWAKKGETTEQEARKLVDSLFNQTTGKNPNQSNSTYSGNNASRGNTGFNLQELTKDIIALRVELEKMRKSNK